MSANLENSIFFEWPRTGKGQFSFQSQRRAMPKNGQTTTQLHSSHTLAKQIGILLSQRHPQEKEMQKGKMVVRGGLTNIREKKRSERQRKKGKIYPFEWRDKEIRKPPSVINAKK